MKMRVHLRIIAALITSVPLLSACEGKLLVADALPADGSDGAAGRGGMVPPPCDCAISPELMPLSCAGDPPRYGSEVFSTTDGGIVAFNVCRDEFVDCDIIYWDGSSSRLISTGKTRGLSASGRQLLAATEDGADFIDLDGSAKSFPINLLGGVGQLSAAGDLAVGTVNDAAGGHLVRVNTRTSELQVHGEPSGVVEASATPDASQIAGFGMTWPGPVSWSFRWRDEQTELSLPGVPEPADLMPKAISADGSSIAGLVVTHGPSGGVYFHWSEAGGYVELPASVARHETWLSSDGNVLLGTLDADGPDPFFPDGPEDTFAFRWTRETGVVPIAPYPTIALDMSHDGGVILAYIDRDEGTSEPTAEWFDAETFVWDDVNGIRELPSLLQRLDEHGVDRRGWLLAQGLKLSGDGKVMFGRGMCGGTPTLYRLVLSD